MNEQDFVHKKQADWNTFRELLEQAEKRGGLARVSRAEARRFGTLYRQVASDLAFARSRATNPDLITYLNSLVSRAYTLLYDSASLNRSTHALWNFYFYEFPALLQKHIWLFLLAFLISIAGGIFAYGMVISQPTNLALFLPEEFKESLEIWKKGDIGAPPSAEFSAQLLTHNTQVGFIAAASGMAFGVPTVSLLFSNGTTLGAFAAVMTQEGKHGSFWPGILPHGIAELTAIFICGAAGLLLGRALLFPGSYARRDALRLCGSEAIRLVLGTIPLFIFAGIIEGMFSHLAISALLRYAFALLNGTIWYAYLFIPRPLEPTVQA
jgi:uncharacterized membrane protein SpoIIM required for sporulation